MGADSFTDIISNGTHDFQQGANREVGQEITGCAATERKTASFNLSLWVKKGYRGFAIYLHNTGSNPFVDLNIYVGKDASHLSDAINADDAFLVMHDPITLAAGKNTILVWKGSILPDTIQVGLKGAGGATVDGEVYLKVS